MDVLIHNGEVTIKGTVADKKAFESVSRSLRTLEEHGGPSITQVAGDTLNSLATFMAWLEESGIVWAQERVKTAPTK